MKDGPPPRRRSGIVRTPLRSATHVVRIVVFPGFQGLDLVGPFEVFAGAADLIAAGDPAAPRAYDVRAVSLTGGPVTTETGLTIATDPLPSADERVDTLVIAGGRGVHAAERDDPLVTAVRLLGERSARRATICSGTFLGAAAGWFDGRSVTTHWARAERLAREHPAVHVDADPIYVRDGDLWTSAGVTAGIDLALAMVEDDHGPEVAQTVARWLVMFLHRPGGQTQFASGVWAPRAERPSVRAAQDAIEAAPGGRHRIVDLARLAAMSPRHFTRVFTDEVGETPGRYVERVRVEAARRALETTTDTVAAIARRCGFGTAETMRRAFVRRLGVAPDHYRRRFGTAA